MLKIYTIVLITYAIAISNFVYTLSPAELPKVAAALANTTMNATEALANATLRIAPGANSTGDASNVTSTTSAPGKN